MQAGTVLVESVYATDRFVAGQRSLLPGCMAIIDTYKKAEAGRTPMRDLDHTNHHRLKMIMDALLCRYVPANTSKQLFVCIR
jgi:hypothetical protein